MAGNTPQSVMVVEDDPIIAFDLETILRDMVSGEVVVFATNRDALAWLAARTPTHAILDFKLTRETTVDTAALLVERTVPTAFVTGYGRDVPLPAALAGCAVFTKPVDRTALVAWLSRPRANPAQPDAPLLTIPNGGAGD